MLRIAGINRPYVTFAFDEAQFERWPEKVIIVSNHASQLDINVCASVIPRPIVYLAKASIRKVPVLGLLNERVGTVFIDRSNKSAAKKSIDNLLDSLSKGISVIVYPEGTRSVDGELNPFKKGAFDNLNIKIEKSFIDRKPNTKYSTTPLGKKEFKNHIKALERIINKQ